MTAPQRSIGVAADMAKVTEGVLWRTPLGQYGLRGASSVRPVKTWASRAAKNERRG